MNQDTMLFKGQQLLADECLSDLKTNYKIDPANQLIIVRGDHGNGKSNFVSYIEQGLPQQDWITIRTSINETTKYDLMIEDLINKIQVYYDKSDEKVKYGNFSIEFANLLAKMQRHTKKNVLLIFDGMRLNHCSRKWFETFQWIISQNEHIAMLMTVEPEKLYKMQHSKDLKFFLTECGRRIDLPRATPNEIQKAFQTLFKEHKRNIDESVLNQITRLTQGNAYAYHVLSNLLLKVTQKGDSITGIKVYAVLNEYDAMLQKLYFDLFNCLSPSEQTFLLGLAQINESPTKLINVINKIRKQAEQDKDDSNQDRSTAYWAAIRKKLTDCNLIVTPAYGTVAFRLPRFAEYVLMASENNLSKMWADADSLR